MLPKAKHLKNLYALDLGTTKFCLATLRETPTGPDLRRRTVSVPAEGMRRGMLANIEQAKAALKQLLETRRASVRDRHHRGRRRSRWQPPRQPHRYQSLHSRRIRPSH